LWGGWLRTTFLLISASQGAEITNKRATKLRKNELFRRKKITIFSRILKVTSATFSWLLKTCP
jgi:hypothetical protein